MLYDHYAIWSQLSSYFLIQNHQGYQHDNYINFWGGWHSSTIKCNVMYVYAMTEHINTSIKTSSCTKQNNNTILKKYIYSSFQNNNWWHKKFFTCLWILTILETWMKRVCVHACMHWKLCACHWCKTFGVTLKWWNSVLMEIKYKYKLIICIIIIHLICIIANDQKKGHTDNQKISLELPLMRLAFSPSLK
jgi:hypothetical protein